jgi:ABC-type multidrug transport system ATPase subunit
MSEIEEFCQTVFVINQGHLVAAGNVRELLRPQERIIRVTFQGRVPDGDFIRRQEEVARVDTVAEDTLEITLARGDSAWLNRRLQEEGFQVSAILPKPKTLKEFFLTITGNHA